MKELANDKTLYAFARDLEPALIVESGETVRIRRRQIGRASCRERV